MEGWIKLHRKLMDNPIVCKDADHLAIWIYLLSNATHKEYPVLFAGKRITLEPGQLIVGRKSLAEKFKIDESKVQRILKCFENEQQIEQQTCNKNRLVSILQWQEYQNIEQQSEQQVNNNCTTTEQQVNTNKNVKELKNVKNKEQKHMRVSEKSEGAQSKETGKGKQKAPAENPDTEYSQEFEEFWSFYPRSIEKQAAYKSWNARLKQKEEPQRMIDASKHYATHCKDNKTDERFIKHAKTFLGPNQPYLDFVEGVPKPRSPSNSDNYSEKDKELWYWLNTSAEGR